MFIKRLATKIIAMDFGAYLDPLTKHRMINAPPLSKYVQNLTPDKLSEDKRKGESKSFIKKLETKLSGRYPRNKKLKHKGDSYIIYEAGQRDPMDPFSKKSFDRLVKENEGDAAEESFTVNKELLEPAHNLPEPSGDNNSYPQAALWWQKAIS